MKVKFTDALAPREGTVADVTPAAARRLIDSGQAVEVKDEKPAAKKAAAKSK